MFRELKDSHSYKKVMTVLALLSFLAALAFSLIGELLLPFAAALYAALILFENPKSRFLSYIVPAAVLAISFIFNGFYALISIEYIILAIVLVITYIRFGTKNECSVYMSAIVAIFFFLSLYLGGVRATGDFSYSSVIEYYSTAISGIRRTLIEFLSSYSIAYEDGTVENIMSEALAASYFDFYSKLIVSAIALFSFAITGITLKLFVFLIFYYSKKGLSKNFLHFIPSNAVAYIYIISTVIYALSELEDLLSVAIANVYILLMIVFAYMGFKYLFDYAKVKQQKSIYFIVIGAVLLLPGVSLQILSFLGTFVTISSNQLLYPPSDNQ